MIVNFNETLGACLIIRKQKYVVLLRYVLETKRVLKGWKLYCFYWSYPFGN